MALSQLFWDVLMPWNLKSTYFSLTMIHFLSLNIWYVIYVVFWIKYWNLKLPHHCILFLFTICTVSQLFWNQVCIFRVHQSKNIYFYTNSPLKRFCFVCLFGDGWKQNNLKKKNILSKFSFEVCFQFCLCQYVFSNNQSRKVDLALLCFPSSWHFTVFSFWIIDIGLEIRKEMFQVQYKLSSVDSIYGILSQ